VGIVLVKASIVYERWPVGAETCSEWVGNKRNFVAIDGVIGNLTFPPC
jgi:hypothetical protein